MNVNFRTLTCDDIENALTSGNMRVLDRMNDNHYLISTLGHQDSPPEKIEIACVSQAEIDPEEHEYITVPPKKLKNLKGNLEGYIDDWKQRTMDIVNKYDEQKRERYEVFQTHMNAVTESYEHDIENYEIDMKLEIEKSFDSCMDSMELEEGDDLNGILN